MDKIRSKRDQNGLKIVCCTKNTFFLAEILFVDITLWENIILKAWEEAPQSILPWFVLWCLSPFQPTLVIGPCGCPKSPDHQLDQCSDWQSLSIRMILIIIAKVVHMHDIDHVCQGCQYAQYWTTPGASQPWCRQHQRERRAWRGSRRFQREGRRDGRWRCAQQNCHSLSFDDSLYVRTKAVDGIKSGQFSLTWTVSKVRHRKLLTCYCAWWDLIEKYLTHQ